MEEWDFYKGFDSNDNDIGYIEKKSIDEMISIASSTNLCIAFNTLGFLKSNVEYPLVKSPYFYESDGIFIHKSFNKQDETLEKMINKTLYPISFSIPLEKICPTMPIKTKIMSNLIPGDVSTYIYNNEEDYYDEYKKSYFAITKKKAGWDCLRHYEIMANGCIPYFIDIEKCPINIISLCPKNLFLKGNLLYEKLKHKNELSTKDINEYNILQKELLEYTKNHLTTLKMAEYILEKTNFQNVSKILFLSGNNNPDYLRCLTLHGFKTLLEKNCHDFPQISHIYKSDTIKMEGLYGKGFTYANLVDPTFHDNDLDNTIENDIRNKYYDIVIYGSYHKGMPYYDLISKVYNSNEIILLCGEDLHFCDYKKYLEKGHYVFVRELR